MLMTSLLALVISVGLVGNKLNTLADEHHKPSDFYFYLILYMGGPGKWFPTVCFQPHEFEMFLKYRYSTDISIETINSNDFEWCYHNYNNKVSKLYYTK